jgi:hypothetical protein
MPDESEEPPQFETKAAFGRSKGTEHSLWQCFRESAELQQALHDIELMSKDCNAECEYCLQFSAAIDPGTNKIPLNNKAIKMNMVLAVKSILR